VGIEEEEPPAKKRRSSVLERVLSNSKHLEQAVYAGYFSQISRLPNFIMSHFSKMKQEQNVSLKN
jgi:hypothetical protein